ncbi:hypothetical protein A3C37_01475 [Candidatus Peribacteria bacterium RIFCSPHIGHO2_02_FULL_53_20]|nr:MAG: hypothetical protein A3C37_01475 [Candidatus Peribacteria bacterium RIFCSPHIGHO2_02_FULL_53_20]OGJ67202.1 MAG: hypothetical protein A3B61_01855 [Candidatus Peribacteria bacterium RIFCSPLOWO2_01_FULL_53_10]OGJ69372.1 MAG: hypothetical protein A3G69_00895 [Candidatus Peribacteria bacterium RIFCSPLOWO2_12_FULL_53_10]
MVHDPTAPATQEDVRLLRVDLHGFVDNVLQQLDGLYVVISDLRGETSDLRVGIDEKISASEDRMVQQFHVIAEQIHHDAIGANRDEIEVVKDRVTRLERHTGLVKR